MREEWTQTTIGSIAEVVGGGTPSTSKAEYWGGEIVWLTPTEVVPRDGDLLVDSERRITRAGLENSGARLLPPGSVILTTRASVGFVALAGTELCTNQGFQSLITSDLVLPKFLMFWIQMNRHEFQSRAAGSTFKEISKSNVKSLKLSLPPLQEQRRIVDLMSSVDSYIATLQQQADAARSARSAVIEQVLVDGDGKWGNVSMGEVLEIARGGSPRPIHDYITTSDDGVNWIKIGDAATHDKYIYATSQKIRPEGVNKSRRVFPGDFLLSNSMSFGRPYILRTDGCIHDGWLLLSGISKHFDEDYLYNVLMSNRVQQQFNSLAAGSGVRNLNIDVASEVRIPIPPIDIQKEIGSLANSFDALVLSTEQTLAVAIELRAGVVSELLSGAHKIPESYDRLLGAA